MENENKKSFKTGNRKKIEVTEENLQVEKKKIETGRVKISKKILEEDLPIDLSGFEEEIEIDRKKIGRVVDKLGPAVRQEGDSSVYSLYKEVYVKQIILEEEVWISKKQVQKSYKAKEKLRREVLDIERTQNNTSKEK